MNAFNFICATVLTFICIGLSGCAQILSKSDQILSREGSLVRVEWNERILEGCKPRGLVTGMGSLGLTSGQKRDRAINEVRNRTALLGANTVFIVSTESMFDETVVRGKAYSCPPE